MADYLMIDKEVKRQLIELSTQYYEGLISVNEYSVKCGYCIANYIAVKVKSDFESEIVFSEDNL